MKIAILCNSSSWGGLEINLFKLGGWLQQRSHTVTIICNPDFRLYKEAEKAGLYTIPIRTGHRKIALAAMGKLSRVCKKEKFDAIIIGLSSNISAAAILKLRGVNKTKMIYLQQMELGISKRDMLHSFLYRHLDAWITPLEILKNQVYNRTRIRKDKVRVIPLCIDTGVFKNGPDKMAARKILSLPQDGFVIGMIGRLDPWKGHITFLKALSLLIKKGYPVTGLIAGVKEEDKSGSYFLQLKQIIAEEGLEEKVFLKPFSADVAFIFAALDFFAMCSHAETFGMVTVEALAAAVPVVGSDSLGTKEILASGKYGLMAEPGNPDSFAARFEELINNPGLAKQIAEWGIEYASTNFHFSRQCDMIEELIREQTKD